MQHQGVYRAGTAQKYFKLNNLQSNPSPIICGIDRGEKLLLTYFSSVT